MNRIQKIKQHLQNNQTVYVVGATCLAVGGVVGMVATGRVDGPLLAKQINILTHKPAQTVIQFVEHSTPSRPVHLVGTQKYWDSVSAAARDMGLDRSLISKNVNGHIPNVKGSIFELVDVAA